MSVARARELAEAWRAGTLRPEEEREFQALLLDGGVLEAPTDEELELEAKQEAYRRKAQRPTRIAAYVEAYVEGARREGRR